MKTAVLRFKSLAKRFKDYYRKHWIKDLYAGLVAVLTFYLATLTALAFFPELTMGVIHDSVSLSMALLVFVGYVIFSVITVIVIDKTVELISRVLAYQKQEYLKESHIPEFRFTLEAVVFYVVQLILLPLTLIEMGVKKLWKSLK